MRYVPFLAAAVVALSVFAAAPRPQAQSFNAPVGVDAPDPNVPLYFEAASIKPSDPKAPPGGGIRRQPGGRFNTFNTPVGRMITLMYQMQEYQLVGGRVWIGNIRYDIGARYEGDPPAVRPGFADHMML